MLFLSYHITTKVCQKWCMFFCLTTFVFTLYEVSRVFLTSQWHNLTIVQFMNRSMELKNKCGHLCMLLFPILNFTLINSWLSRNLVFHLTDVIWITNTQKYQIYDVLFTNKLMDLIKLGIGLAKFYIKTISSECVCGISNKTETCKET